MSEYAQERAKELVILTRKLLRDMPDVCSDFILAISATTQPLTRYAYTTDMKLFVQYLLSECPKFADHTAISLSAKDFEIVTARDIRMYLEYLSLYYNKDDEEISNGEVGKLRKLSTLRSFYKYMFKNGLISSNVTELIEMPKRHEKPIIRMEIEEVSRMLDMVETGSGMSERQKAYNRNTKVRDLAILTLFLDTGIRVSELVGLNISDFDFSINGFLVTRKGGNQAILYFSEEAEEAIRQYLSLRKEMSPLPGNEDALFLSMQNKRMSIRSVQVMVKKYASLAAPLKQHLSPHKLRSTYGTNLYHATGDIYLVADVLGHSDVNTTRKHYAAMSDDRRRMAAGKVRIREKQNESNDENDVAET